MEEFHINILNISAVLLSAYLGGVLIRRIGYPAILGELLIGIILGPGLLGWIEMSAAIKVLSEIGIILLMVYIGMEIDFHDLKKASWPGLLAAFGGFFVPFFLGYFTIVWMGGTPISGLFVAIAIGVTSLATKSRILIDLKLLNTRIAYVLMAGALISDTLALVIFSGITSFAESSTVNLPQLLLIGGKILGFFAITIGVGVFVLPRLGKLIAHSGIKSSTAFFTLILIVAFGYCELAELAGMHSILGAFMAGLFLKGNLFPKTISKELHKSFYDVSIGFMAPIFFVSAGFLVDISVFKTDLLLLVLVTLLAVIGKIVGTALFYIPSRNGWREGLTIGTGMNGRGAVEIIIAEIGLQMGIIDNTIFSILVFMAIFTTLTVPVFLSWTSNWLRRRGELVYMDKRKGVLILGVNPLSLFMAQRLAPKVPVTMIDNNREMAARAREAGFECINGNALNEDKFAEALPENRSTFIGMTTNSQVNLMAGKMAKESFLVPNVVAAISKKELEANRVLMQTLEIPGLFSGTIQLEKWCQLVSQNMVEEALLTVQDDSDVLPWMQANKDALKGGIPLLVENAEGNRRPFHQNTRLKATEKVLVLKATA